MRRTSASGRSLAPSVPSCRTRLPPGFSLVEVMVALVITMIGTIAMMTAFARFEGQKRTTTAGNDAQQAGTYALFEMERQIRTAGSALIQGRSAVYAAWGCAITARNAGAAVLPLPGTLPAPFDVVPATVRALPVIVHAGSGATSDVLAVVSGNPSVRTFGAKIELAAANAVRMKNSTFGYYANDYLLAGDGSGNCALGVIGAPPDPVARDLLLRDDASPPTGFQGKRYLFDLGTRPIFALYGVNAQRNTLQTYDLLQRDGAAAAEISDGIVAMKALYGVDNGAGGTAGDGIVVAWVAPTGAWAASLLTDGSEAAAVSTYRIKAVRLAVVSRVQLGERESDHVGATTLSLFADVPAAAVTLPIESRYRYKIYDTTIPLHNAAIESIY